MLHQPKLGGQAAWTRKWEWEKARMLGKSDTASIPSQKQDTKHRLFVLLCSRQKRSSSSFTATPGSSRSVAGVWCQRCGVMAFPVSRALPVSLFHAHSHTNMVGLTPSRRGEQTGGGGLSVSEDTNDEQRNCQISRLSTSHTLFATGGVNTVLNSPKPQQHQSHRAAEDLFFHSFNLSKGNVQLTAHLDFTLLTSHLLENWTGCSLSVGKERPPSSSRQETDSNGGNMAQEQAGTGARRGCNLKHNKENCDEKECTLR